MNHYDIIVIGSVGSTAKTIERLVFHHLNVVGIIGYEPQDNSMVSGWTDLRSIAFNHGIKYKPYQKINDPEIIDWAKAFSPDIIFAVGFSQLLSNEWLEMPKLGCIGFHPTLLPKGRGRAPVAWLILKEKKGAATFFLMDEGADSGPIFVQEPFEIEANDDASCVERKIKVAIEKALDKWLPELKKGIWEPKSQNELDASWYGIRKPEDGLIDWNQDAMDIDLLIKAANTPHPGAYFYFKRHQIIVHQSLVERTLNIHGVVGRVLLTDDLKGYLVQCGNGLIWINDLEFNDSITIRVGNKLSYQVEDEIQHLWQEIEQIKTHHI